jgi:hypothetical protein
MDGLLRGVMGILLGAWLYAEAYPFLILALGVRAGGARARTARH